MRKHSGSRCSSYWIRASLAGLALVALAGCKKKPLPAPAAPSLRFTDRAAEAGLDHVWTIPGKRPLNILQTIGNGCAFLDFDTDGALDVLLVGSPTRLYRGDGKGRFQEVSEAAGIASLRGRLLGCAVGDYDNDGFPDLYLSGYRTGKLLHNEGGKHFREVTTAAGLRAQPWGTSCSFTDVDADGRLDLIVANYAQFGPETGIPQLCTSNGILTSCGPRYYKPLKPVLYRNLGNGRFSESPLAAANGRGLGVAALALGEARPTIALANDELPGDLLQSEAAGTPYRNMASLAGTAVDRQGNIHGGMGIDWGDFDRDGRFDLFVTTFENEPKSLYRAVGAASFTDVSSAAGLDPPLLRLVSFGTKFLDADNDGWLDLLVASGHVQDNIARIDSSASYRQRTVLLRNQGAAPGTLPRFENASAGAGAFFDQPIVGRGLATGDYDNDGGLDALVVDSEGRPALLHNDSRRGRWLSVLLHGTKSNREGLGAIVELRTPGGTLTRHCHTDGSYLSASDRRLHFGLGDAGTVESLTVRWPSGTVQTLRTVGVVNRQLSVREGDTSP